MTQEAAAPTLREASGSGLDDEPMMFTSPYYNDAQKLEFARVAIRFRNDVIANLRTRLAALAARPADPVEPSVREEELIDELRAVARAYPEDVFLPLDDEDKKHPLTIQRASAAMGRHMAPLLLRAAAALAASPADPVEATTLPSSRERWNAENPGELSFHTFDDDATPASPKEPTAREPESK